MKKGLRPGVKYSVTFEVDKTMIAAFGGRTIHNVLSTFRLVYYAEFAARKLVEPYLKDDEEAAGFEISLKHIAPTQIGQKVVVTASFIERRKKKLICRIEAVNSTKKICVGRQTQVLIRKRGLD